MALTMMQVCGPWDYHSIVVPGPSWDFGDQDGGPSANPGTVLVPTRDHSLEWLETMVSGVAGGPLVNGLYYGGWWHGRSLVAYFADSPDNEPAVGNRVGEFFL